MQFDGFLSMKQHLASPKLLQDGGIFNEIQIPAQPALSKGCFIDWLLST